MNYDIQYTNGRGIIIVILYIQTRGLTSPPPPNGLYEEGHAIL